MSYATLRLPQLECVLPEPCAIQMNRAPLWRNVWNGIKGGIVLRGLVVTLNWNRDHRYLASLDKPCRRHVTTRRSFVKAQEKSEMLLSRIPRSGNLKCLIMSLGFRSLIKRYTCGGLEFVWNRSASQFWEVLALNFSTFFLRDIDSNKKRH